MRGYEDSKVPRLFKLMEERHIKATELSKETGIAKGSITDWKRGKSIPSGKRLITLCSFFDVSAEYLLGTEDSENEKAEVPVSEDAKKIAAIDAITNVLSQKIIIELNNLNEAQKKHLLAYMKFLQENDDVAADEVVAMSIRREFKI